MEIHKGKKKKRNGINSKIILLQNCNNFLDFLDCKTFSPLNRSSCTLDLQFPTSLNFLICSHHNKFLGESVESSITISWSSSSSLLFFLKTKSLGPVIFSFQSLRTSNYPTSDFLKPSILQLCERNFEEIHKTS